MKARLDKLDTIGFTWNAQEAAWDRSFQQLETFQKEHGHCNGKNMKKRNAVEYLHQQHLTLLPV